MAVHVPRQHVVQDVLIEGRPPVVLVHRQDQHHRRQRDDRAVVELATRRQLAPEGERLLVELPPRRPEKDPDDRPQEGQQGKWDEPLDRRLL